MQFRSCLVSVRLPVILAAIITFAVSAFGVDDTTPPELKTLAFTPSSIDTSAGPVEVTITFTVTDDASGANYFEAMFVDSSGGARQSASLKFAPANSATKSVTVTFPRFSNAGTWTLAHVFVSDAARNTLVLDANGVGGRGFPTKLEVISTRDTVSPKLAALDIAPAEIDTTAAPAEVKVRYTATDDMSGVSHFEIGFVSPTGARRNSSVSFSPAKSVSNTMALTFPRLSEAGEWTLGTVFLSDAAGNTLILSEADLVRLGFRPTLTVKSAQDTTPPSLTALHIATEAIDTSRGPATVQVDISATDDISGVNYIELKFDSPSGNAKQGSTVRFSPERSVSKSIAVTFPALSEAGTWMLNSVMLSDAAGNTAILDEQGLAALGAPRALEVKSMSDATPPQLTGLRFSPYAIDTSRGAATVDVEFEGTDDLSGIKSIEIAFVSPSGSTRIGSAAYTPSTDLHGSVRVSFPQASEPGVWKLASIILADAAGNNLVLDAEALATRVAEKLEVK